MFFRIAHLTATAVFLFALSASAENTAGVSAAQSDAILILDASGSMWGQIDGVNKIVIAKDVVEGLVRSLPHSQRLGLVAYGHRKKGDCNDIETLADVGGDREKMISKIRGLSPRGKTPLTKSVGHAARALNYEKNAATVILVSDGLETCEADPCALAKTLEENGLDFTVHVVGFDVTEQERKGLECIARETSGQFLSADNADELTAALSQVTQLGSMQAPVEGGSKPQPIPLVLKATILSGGPEIQSELGWAVWAVDDNGKEAGEPIFTAENTGYEKTVVPPGDYVVEAAWTGWRKGQPDGGAVKKGRQHFTISGHTKVVTVPIDLGIAVTLEAPASTPEGVAFDVTWTGPDTLGAYVQVNRLDDGPRETIYGAAAQKARDAYLQAARKGGKAEADLDTDGDGDFDQDDRATVAVGGPSVEGEYEVRYVLAKPRLILARRPITVTDSQYRVSAPQQVPAATTFAVNWSGTMTAGDFITIEKKGTAKAFTPFGGRPRLEQGVPMVLEAPAEPGDYEVRYVLANGYTLYGGMQHVVQAMQPVKVTDVQADVNGPATVVGGSTVSFDVSPPAVGDFTDDYVSVVKPGAEKYNRDSWASLSRGEVPGKNVQLRVPAVAGDYELVYYLAPGNRALVRKPITVTQAPAAVNAPDVVKAGEGFDVQYSGDAFRGDRIVICPADTPDNKMWQWGVNYGMPVKKEASAGTYSAAQSTRNLKPGEYEARYVTGIQHVVLARDKFSVVE